MEKYIPDTDILYDINLDYGEYNKEISLTRFMLTHFIRYVGLKRDQVPFSNGFGSDIKNLIQKKNNDLTKTILYEEIDAFLSSLSSMYNKSFSVKPCVSGLSILGQAERVIVGEREQQKEELLFVILIILGEHVL